MEKARGLLQDLVDKAEIYATSTLEVAKLKAVKTTAEVTGIVISHVVLLVVLSSCLLMLNIGLSIWIGELMGAMHLGFLIVSGFYLLVALAVYFLLQRVIHEPITKYIIRKFLN